MERIGKERTGTDRNGAYRNGEERNGKERTGKDWNGSIKQEDKDYFLMVRSGMDWIGMEWKRKDRTGSERFHFTLISLPPL